METIILTTVILLLVVANIRIVSQSHAYVIERLGTYKTTWGAGLHIKIPLIESISKKVSLKEQIKDFPPQAVITSDNVTMRINTVVYYQVTDAKLYAYGVENPVMAIENLTATTLRNIIGEIELDQTLTSRDVINTKLRATLDEATDDWGIKINRVELKDIIPPESIVTAMTKQMKAERERRESILRAEGEKESAILVAQGKKQSAILNAEAKKESTILQAEATREKNIREAEGQAEAIIKINEATAKGIKIINASMPSKEVLTLKSLEAFEKVANGNATKIIIPSEIQDLSGLLTSLKETITDNNIKTNLNNKKSFKNEDKPNDLKNKKLEE